MNNGDPKRRRRQVVHGRTAQVDRRLDEAGTESQMSIVFENPAGVPFNQHFLGNTLEATHTLSCAPQPPKTASKPREDENPGDPDRRKKKPADGKPCQDQSAAGFEKRSRRGPDDERTDKRKYREEHRDEPKKTKKRERS